MSQFLAESYRPQWHSNLKETLLDIEESMKKRSLIIPHHHSNEEDEAPWLHLDRMNRFYDQVGGAQWFKSNLSCFSCLRDMPEHPLPCGHVVCSPCARMFGRQSSKTSFLLENCPLQWNDQFDSAVEISMKPVLAGIRVLSLDGYVFYSKFYHT